MNKSSSRTRLLAQRMAMSREARAKASSIILTRLKGLTAWDEAASILVYLPIRGEVDTWPLFNQCLAQGRTLLAPCCRKDEPGRMDVLQVTHASQLIEGAYKIPEPDRRLCPLQDDPCPDMVLVPGVGFDRQGFRIGYGGGYYDRFFAAHPMPTTLRIGLAFACQVRNHLPHDPWDIRVHTVVTQDEIIRHTRSAMPTSTSYPG